MSSNVEVRERVQVTELEETYVTNGGDGIVMSKHVSRLTPAEKSRLLAELPESSVDVDGRRVDEMDLDFMPVCLGCRRSIESDDRCFDDYRDGDSLCEHCVEPFQEAFREQAKNFAVRNCQVGELADYDPKRTPRRYFSSCRHGCSNYDDLLLLLSRCSGKDILHWEIKARINSLVEERIRAKFDRDFADFILENRNLDESTFRGKFRAE